MVRVSAQLQLEALGLAAARAALADASLELASGQARAPAVEMPSVTGIGAEVRRFICALGMVGLALADTAAAAARTLDDTIRTSAELDDLLADSIYGGYALHAPASYGLAVP